MPDLRFHPGAPLLLTKGMSLAINMDAIMVMNIAVSMTVARVTMTQTVILKTVSAVRVQIAKTTILNQLEMTG